MRPGHTKFSCDQYFGLASIHVKNYVKKIENFEEVMEIFKKVCKKNDNTCVFTTSQKYNSKFKN